jgi:penicillin-binding protein activator
MLVQPSKGNDMNHWLLSTLVIFITSCGGPRTFTKGAYDDPTRVELLDDKFNESDMQQMAETVIQSLNMCRYLRMNSHPPVVMLERVTNRTQEHIDTASLTEKVRTALIKAGTVRFIDKEARETLESEFQFAESGAVSASTAKKRGKQIAADYVLSGAIATNIQEVGADKFVYYKLTMNLTNLETSTIDCTEEKEIRKKYKKRTYSL